VGDVFSGADARLPQDLPAFKSTATACPGRRLHSMPSGDSPRRGSSRTARRAAPEIVPGGALKSADAARISVTRSPRGWYCIEDLVDRIERQPAQLMPRRSSEQQLPWVDGGV